jgi:hypothetical protein
MGKFTVIPQNTFEGLQLDAGVILNRFNPANPVAPADADIVCATTGGISVSCKANFSDLGEDVDNVPNNMKELKHLDSWDCSMAFTSLGTSSESLRLSLGAADINAQTGAITPRKDLKQTDFADLWWVGDRADGGLVAVQLKNALSTEGFTLQTTKNGKGTVAVTLTGHVSMNAQNTMPMAFYSQDPSENDEFTVTQILSHVTSSFVDGGIEEGTAFSATLTADTGYTLENVVVTMGGVDVTDIYYDAGVVSIASSAVNGDIVIMATANTTV